MHADAAGDGEVVAGDVAGGSADAKVRAVIATAFACLDAASMTWVDQDDQGDIMDLYDECLAAVRGC